MQTAGVFLYSGDRQNTTCRHTPGISNNAVNTSLQRIQKFLIRGGAITVIGQVGNILINLVLLSLIAKLANPEVMAVYVVTLSVAYLIGLLSTHGTELTLLEKITKALADSDKPKSANQVLLGFKSTTMVGIICFIIWMMAGDAVLKALMPKISLDRSILWIIGIWGLCQGWQRWLAEVYRAKRKMLLSVSSSGLFGRGAAVLALLILWRNEETLTVVLVLSLVTVCSLVAVLPLLLTELLGARKLNQGKVKLREAIELSRYSLPLMVALLVTFVMARADVWVMGTLAETTELAIYGAAARLTLVVLFVMQIANMLVPAIVNELIRQNQTRELQDLLQSVAAISALPALLFTILFAWTGDRIMSAIYTPDYAPGGIALFILSAGYLVSAICGSSGKVLTVSGYGKHLMAIGLISVLMILPISLYAFKSAGWLSVPMAFSLTKSINSMVKTFYARKKVGVWTVAHPGKFFHVFNKIG